jgi:DNA-directed RNA polymerase specialized sigma24 family protein
VNTDELEHATYEAERRVLEIQAKLHRCDGTCGAPGAMRVARRVREAARRNGSIERRDRASGRLHLPQAFAQVAARQPKPFDQPSPQFAWLCHPAVTGLEQDQWTALVRALGALHEDQREVLMRRRRGRDRKHARAADTGRPPTLTLVDRLLAVILRDRLALPMAAIAELFGVAPETVRTRIGQIRGLLDLLGRRLQPAKDQPASLAELRQRIENIQMISNYALKQAS